MDIVIIIAQNTLRYNPRVIPISLALNMEIQNATIIIVAQQHHPMDLMLHDVTIIIVKVFRLTLVIDQGICKNLIGYFCN